MWWIYYLHRRREQDRLLRGMTARHNGYQMELQLLATMYTGRLDAFLETSTYQNE